MNILLVVAYLDFGIGLLNLRMFLKGFGLVKEGLFNGFSGSRLVIWTTDKYRSEYINYFSALWGRNFELSNKI